MLQGFYTAASGMNFQMDQLTEIAANLANVNTAGYKRTEAIGQAFDNLVVQFSHPTVNDQIGAGVQNVGRTRYEQQGSLQRTTNPLDFALTGQGYFQIQEPNGAVQVTRNGAFRLDAQGFLATGDGARVLSSTNQQIQLGNLGTPIRALANGTLLSGNTPVAQLKVVSQQTANTPDFPASTITAPAVQNGFTVEQGYLEGSNVNIVTEMVNMITVNKAFTFGQKAISANDDVLNKTVNNVSQVQ